MEQLDKSLAPQNVSIRKVAQGWVLTWLPPIRLPDDLVAVHALQSVARLNQNQNLNLENSNLNHQAAATGGPEIVYWIEYREIRRPASSASKQQNSGGQGQPMSQDPAGWVPLTSTGENSMLVKDLKAGADYQFRIFAQSAKSGFRAQSWAEFRFQVPDTRKKPGGTQALSAGVVSGVLFFIACIVIAVCAVNICNKRRKKRAEKGLLHNDESYHRV